MCFYVEKWGKLFMIHAHAYEYNGYVKSRRVGRRSPIHPVDIFECLNDLKLKKGQS